VNRRLFIKFLIGGVSTAAAVRSFPFRVYSFPKEIVIPESPELIFPPLLAPGLRHLFSDYLDLERIRKSSNLTFKEFFSVTG
jgi:hypothetical protein